MRVMLLLLLACSLGAALSPARAQKLTLSDTEALELDQAALSVEAGDFEKAIPALERFVEAHEVSPIAVHLLLIRSLDGVGKREAALKAAFRAEAQYPKSSLVALRIAELLISADQAPFEARHYLEVAATSVAPAPAMLLFGEWAFRRGEYELAIEQFQQARDAARGVNSTVAKAVTWIARCFATQGTAGKAEEAFQQALRLYGELGMVDEEQVMHFVRFLQAQQREAEPKALQRELEEHRAAASRLAPNVQLNGEPQRLQ